MFVLKSRFNWKSAQDSVHPNFQEEIAPSLESEGNMEWDTFIVKDECDSMKAPVALPPELFYFLDLASFFDPNIVTLNEQNKRCCPF